MFTKLWDEHPGMLFGLIIGVLVGLVFLFVGFWKTIIFIGFVIIGLYIGKKFDKRENIKDILEEILPDKFFK